MQFQSLRIARSLTLWSALVGLTMMGLQAERRWSHGSQFDSFHRPAHWVLSDSEVLTLFQSRLRGYPALMRDDLSRYFLRLCKKYQFHPVFLMSVIDVESGFRVNAVSHKGAVGLMQVMPATAQFIAAQYRLPYSSDQSDALSDPYVNLQLGVAYLAWLRERYAGNAGLFLAAYNVGHGAVDRHVAAHAGAREIPPRRKIYFESVYKRYFEKLARLKGKSNV